MRLSSVLAVASVVAGHGAAALRGDGMGSRPNNLVVRNSFVDSTDLDDVEKRAGPLQNIVTWDEHSLFINGSRVLIYSGEFHPFRLPVPSLWLDVFQKIRALGLNGVSFYVDWALLEGKPGEYIAEGVFDLEPFFAAAKEAGIYLIARPGPYINAEASGGGFPGWLQRLKGHLRTNDSDYLHATDNYISNIASTIAKAQITNGGPVILYQPENEYSGAISGFLFPDPSYMQYVEDQARNAGIVVPFVSNDAYNGGHNAPGTGEGEVDIYGHDGYPLGFDCGNPTTWPAGSLPTYYRSSHLTQSPSTPFTIPEFQGGSFDPWGGWGFAQCSELLNQEQVRVFYKNNYAAGVAIFSLYMIFGGTNWGNLGHPGGYTSYDYGAAIAEDRTIVREKYSELKLEAHFLQASPGYLVANAASSNVTGVFSSSTAVTITAVTGPNGSFYVVRHYAYGSTDSTPYTLNLPTSAGNLSIPQLGGTLTLTRRDSKVHVVDYPLGDAGSLLYSTAEIFTWQKFEQGTVLIVYGGATELHELAIKTSETPVIVGDGIVTKVVNGALVAQWQTTTDRRILKLGDLSIYILDRNTAYNFWAPELSLGQSLIINGPYLVRSASIDGSTLSVKADFNKTTTIEIIGVPSSVTSLTVNGATLQPTKDDQGAWIASTEYTAPSITLPDLKSLAWKTVDSLPELKSSYDDSAWVDADHTTTNNTYTQPLLTPVVLYGSDYGFNTGALILRGHFTASGRENKFLVTTQGGSAFASAVWLNDTFLGSWAGTDAASANNGSYTVPKLIAGRRYVLTVVIDNMGLDENWTVGTDEMKDPRGILAYTLANANCGGTTTAPPPTPITWKITGNLGGEDYADRARGPLNEGGLFAERQGFHLPAPAPVTAAGSPFAPLEAAGIAFYTAPLALDIPAAQWDVPLAFAFANDTAAAAAAAAPYRAWLYVNGWQFGRYVSNVGPQAEFPVPEGILDYGGENWVALAVWAVDAAGATVPDLALKVAGTPVLTGREKVEVVESPKWTARPGAY